MPAGQGAPVPDCLEMRVGWRASRKRWSDEEMREICGRPSLEGFKVLDRKGYELCPWRAAKR